MTEAAVRAGEALEGQEEAAGVSEGVSGPSLTGKGHGGPGRDDWVDVVLVRAGLVQRGWRVDVYGQLAGAGCDGHLAGVEVERVWLDRERVRWDLSDGRRVYLMAERLVFAVRS